MEGVDVGLQAFVLQLLDQEENLVEIALLAPEVDAIVDFTEAAAAVQVLVMVRAAVVIVLVVVGVGSERGRAACGGGGACTCCCRTLGVECLGGGRGTADE